MDISESDGQYISYDSVYQEIKSKWMMYNEECEQLHSDWGSSLSSSQCDCANLVHKMMSMMSDEGTVNDHIKTRYFWEFLSVVFEYHEWKDYYYIPLDDIQDCIDLVKKVINVDNEDEVEDKINALLGVNEDEELIQLIAQYYSSINNN